MGNKLLASLNRPSLERLKGCFERVALPYGHKCSTSNQSIENIYFPTRGIVARHVCGRTQAFVNAGVYGRDGFSGLSVILGIDRSPHEDIVRVPGEALRIPIGAFTHLVEQDGCFRAVLLRFAYCLALQASCSALSSSAGDLGNRLSRLLIMCHDRVDGHELVLTHSFLATTLGVRRASVTSAIHHLEGARFIKATRGRVLIKDRAALETIAGASYGVAEREYDRLIG